MTTIYTPGPKDIKKHPELANLVWWREAAAIVDCTLIGWTGRQEATFRRAGMQRALECPGWLAETFHSLEIDKGK